MVFDAFVKLALMFVILCVAPTGVSAEEQITKPIEASKVSDVQFRLKEDGAGNAQVSTTGDALKMLAGLGGVIALILGMAWFSRRMNMNFGGNSQGIKITAAASVGTKERLVIVEVENQRLLLGVTAGQINLLKDLAATEATNVNLSSDFSSKIKSLLNTKVSDNG